MLSQTINTSADLSGDRSANDISRLFMEVTVDVSGDAVDLTVVASHWKSGTGNDDDFRRVVEASEEEAAQLAIAGLTWRH